MAAFALQRVQLSLLTYLVLYLQNVLHLSAVATGVRFLVLSGALFVTAGLAGRLTNLVPIKWLIGPGFVLLGVGLYLMRGITLADSWTHLVPGLLLAGLGAGFINVPLASTAVGVVEPARSGMASGVNSTFRQVGIATGIAALGSIFASQIRTTISAKLASTPLRGAAKPIENAVLNGETPAAGAGHPSAATTHLVHTVAAQGLINGLNEILLIGAVIAFVAAAASFVLIRQKDFTASAAPGRGGSRGAVSEAQPAPAAVA